MTETNRDILNAAAREDFSVFLEIMAPLIVQDFKMAPCLSLLAQHVEDTIIGTRPRQVINLPPRHLKSIVASVLGSAWALGRNPKQQILCVSHSETLARDFADKTMWVMLLPR